VTVASNDSDVDAYTFALQGTGSTAFTYTYMPFIAK
jgi:hypothetical protein